MSSYEKFININVLVISLFHFKVYDPKNEVTTFLLIKSCYLVNTRCPYLMLQPHSLDGIMQLTGGSHVDGYCPI